MPGHDAIHPGNLALIDGVVFDDLYEGNLERMAAAEWLGRHPHDIRAGSAVRRTRDGEEGVCFHASDGVVWRLRWAGSGEG